MIARGLEVIHAAALAIDGLGAVGFALAGVWLSNASTRLLRGIGWLFAAIALVYLSRFVLGIFDLESLYATGVGDLFRVVIVLMVWVFVVRHLFWFPWNER
jgi:hypothetical protein